MKTIPVSIDFLEQSKEIAKAFLSSGQVGVCYNTVKDHVELIDKMLDNLYLVREAMRNKKNG